MVGDGEAEELLCLSLCDGVACAGEGGEEGGRGGGVALLLCAEGEVGEDGFTGESGAEDGGGPLGIHRAGDAAGGGGDEAREGIRVGGAGERAGAGFGHHGESAAEGEGDDGLLAPFGAGGEGICGVLAGLHGLEFGAAGDGAAALPDDLADNGIVFLRHLRGGLRGQLQEEGWVAEDIQEGIPAGGGVVFGAEEEHARQVDGAGLCDDDAGGVQGLPVDGAGGGGWVVEPRPAARGANEAPGLDDLPALEGGRAADLQSGDASEVAHGEVRDGLLQVGDGGEAGAQVGGLCVCEGFEGGVCGDGVCICLDARGEVLDAADAGGDDGEHVFIALLHGIPEKLDAREVAAAVLLEEADGLLRGEERELVLALAGEEEGVEDGPEGDGLARAGDGGDEPRVVRRRGGIRTR